jgi:hypothetical protein
MSTACTYFNGVPFALYVTSLMPFYVIFKSVILLRSWGIFDLVKYAMSKCIND